MIQIKRMPIKFLRNLDTNILVQLLFHAVVDVIDIVTNSFPLQMCKSCHQIRQTRFYRKPISNTIEEAEKLLLANEYNVKGQVGHVERFNPIYRN
jgi:predicted nucleic-acid-binding Zn-ribbon protein